MHWKRTFCLLCLLFFVAKGSLIAEERSPSSSAGILEKQVQREFEPGHLPQEKETPLLEVDIEYESLDVPPGLSIRLNEVRVEGNVSLPPREIESVISPYLHREVSGKEVKQLCLEIDKLYAGKGYILAWTYPPVQKVKDGVLVLKVLEGTLEKIHIEGNRLYKTAYIEKFFAHLLGKSVNYNSLMEALLLVNENFNLHVRAVLKKGESLGGVSLLCLAKDELPLSISAGYNNWGTNITTYNQMLSNIQVGNVVTSGDRLALMTAFGLPPVFYYVNPTYSIPVNGKGTKLELSYLFSFSNIQQQKELDLSGWSEIGTVAVSHPLMRTRAFESDFYLTFDIKQVKNFEGKYATSIDKLRVLGFGGSLDYVDTFQGRTYCNGFLHIGIPDFLGASSVVNPMSSREGAGGRYWIANFSLQRAQLLPYDMSCVFSSAAQATVNKLPIPEQFAIGGVGTVRGYPSAAACGDNGYYVNAEWYIPPPLIKDKIFRPMKTKWKDILQFLLFVDHGGTYTNTFVPQEYSSIYLTAAGAGFRVYGPHGLKMSFDAAFPLTDRYKQFNSFVYFRLDVDLY